MVRTHALGLAAALLVLLSASVVAARPPTLSAGASPGLAIGTSGNVLVLNHFPDQGFDFWFGLRSSDDTAFSLASFFLTPDLAIALTLGNVVIGARVELGFYHVNPDGPFGGDQNFGFFGLVPFFEYWLDGEDMAPYFGLSIGPSIVVADGRDTEVWLEAAGMGGLGFFVSEGFSLGPTLAVQFLYDSASERAGWGIVLGFDLRGWIGLGGEGGSSTGGDTGGGGGGGGADDGGSTEPAWTPEPASDDPEGGLE
jgi:hypothetical protein